MSYDVELTQRAEKELGSLARDVAQRIVSKLAEYAAEEKGDVKKLVNFSPEYRLRVGDYRVLFEIEGERIVVYRIRHRSSAYR